MNYPNLLRRYLASLIDMVILLFFVYLYGNSPMYAPRGPGILIALAAFLSFEPLMTAFACTPGQALMRFRVRGVEGLARVPMGYAYLRSFTKYLLGIISFATLPLRRDRRAIHDLVAGSIVIEAKAAKRGMAPAR